MFVFHFRVKTGFDWKQDRLFCSTCGPEGEGAKSKLGKTRNARNVTEDDY